MLGLRVGACLGAFALVDEGGLPRQHALVQAAAAVQDLAVHGDPLARQHAQHIPLADAGRGRAHHLQRPWCVTCRRPGGLDDQPALRRDQLRQCAQVGCTGSQPVSTLLWTAWLCAELAAALSGALTQR